MPLALPFLAVGAMVAMLTRRSIANAPAPSPSPTLPPAAPPEPPPPPSAPPSPLAVFVQFLEAKLTPPDLVIWCASAEAEMNGNTALARQIADRYPEAMARRVARAAPSPAAQAQGAPTPAATPAQTAAPMAPAIAHAMAPTSAQASPIEGVSDEQWRALCERLVRGDAMHDSGRRVGRYCQRKDRLREIGFDPESLIGAPEAQDDAFAADMADTYRHLAASGELAKHVGRPISIPDAPDGIPITLSGLFGVASVAGLEDMMEWLSSKSDRKKFPNTTAAFVRANGIF